MSIPDQINVFALFLEDVKEQFSKILSPCVLLVTDKVRQVENVFLLHSHLRWPAVGQCFILLRKVCYQITDPRAMEGMTCLGGF